MKKNDIDAILYRKSYRCSMPQYYKMTNYRLVLKLRCRVCKIPVWSSPSSCHFHSASLPSTAHFCFLSDGTCYPAIIHAEKLSCFNPRQQLSCTLNYYQDEAFTDGTMNSDTSQFGINKSVHRQKQTFDLACCLQLLITFHCLEDMPSEHEAEGAHSKTEKTIFTRRFS